MTTIKYRENLYRDDDKYEWKYNDVYDYLKNQKIKPYNKYTKISNNVRIFIIWFYFLIFKVIIRTESI